MMKTFNLTRKASVAIANVGVKTIDDIPGPPIFPVVGTSYTRIPYGLRYHDEKYTTFREDMYKKYGPIYKEKLIDGPFMLSVHKNNHLRTVFMSQGIHPIRPVNDILSNYRKNHPNLYDHIGLGDSLGEMGYEFRQKLGKSVSRINTPEQMIECLSSTADKFNTLIECNKNKNEEVDIAALSFRYTLDAIWVHCFGERLGAVDENENTDAQQMIGGSLSLFDELSKTIEQRIQWWKYITTPSYTKTINAEIINRRIIEKTCRKYLENSQWPETDAHLKSFLHILQSKSKLSEKDTILTLMEAVISGTITMSFFISTFLHKLAQNPRVLKKLRKEIDSVLDSPTSTVTSEMIKLPYLTATLEEGLRLCGIVPYLARYTQKPIVLDDYYIPENTTVLCHLKIPSMSEENFSLPKEFIPERWLNPNHPFSSPDYALFSEEIEHAKYMHLQFGFGNRSCLGRRIARTNMLILLLKIIRNFDMHSEGNLQLVNRLVLAPKDEVLVGFTKRIK